MKIGIDIRLIGKKQTGSEAVFFNLVKNLALIDEKNNYLLFTDVSDQSVLGKIKKDLGIEERKNFEIISLETKNRFSWNFWTLPKYLRKNPVDVYLTQYITPFFVPRKVKILTIIHDVSFLAFPQFIKRSDLFFLRTLIPLSIRRADKVIGVSQFTRDEIIKYYKVEKEKVDFIYNAVSENFLSQEVTAADLAAVRQKYHLPEQFILYLGTLQPRKNIPTLIEAFIKLRSGAENIRLVIAGGRSHNFDQKIDDLLKKSSLNENDVIFTGYVPEEEKKALISAATWFCFPSYYEGFGIPILEAFDCGVACVLSDIPPQREVAKEAALFFSASDAEKLAAELSSVLESKDLRDGLVLKGRACLEQFSWKATARKILTIFGQFQ